MGVNSSGQSGGSTELPKNFKLQYSKSEIGKIIDRLGSQISIWSREVSDQTGKDVIAVPILRGALFFAADLLRATGKSLEICPIHASAYDIGENRASIEGVKIQAATMSVKGRSLLLLDDICDSGRTLQVLKEYFIGMGAADVRSAVLIRRKHAGNNFFPEWSGFEYPGQEWFVGFGMDDRDRYRNLADVYVIQK